MSEFFGMSTSDLKFFFWLSSLMTVIVSVVSYAIYSIAFYKRRIK